MGRTAKRRNPSEPQGRTVQIDIRRFNPGAQKSPVESTYILDYFEGMTLHSALEQIYRKLDPSLAFRPYNCNKGVCMSCLVSVNGKRQQACTSILKPGDHLLIEPDSAHPLVRDLVTLP